MLHYVVIVEFSSAGAGLCGGHRYKIEAREVVGAGVEGWMRCSGT